MADELETVLASYQVGYRDAIEEILRIATEKLREKVKEIELNANSDDQYGGLHQVSTPR